MKVLIYLNLVLFSYSMIGNIVYPTIALGSNSKSPSDSDKDSSLSSYSGSGSDSSTDSDSSTGTDSSTDSDSSTGTVVTKKKRKSNSKANSPLVSDDESSDEDTSERKFKKSLGKRIKDSKIVKKIQKSIGSKKDKIKEQHKSNIKNIKNFIYGEKPIDGKIDTIKKSAYKRLNKIKTQKNNSETNYDTEKQKLEEGKKRLKKHEQYNNLISKKQDSLKKKEKEHEKVAAKSTALDIKEKIFKKYSNEGIISKINSKIKKGSTSFDIDLNKKLLLVPSETVEKFYKNRELREKVYENYKNLKAETATKALFDDGINLNSTKYKQEFKINKEQIEKDFKDKSNDSKAQIIKKYINNLLIQQILNKQCVSLTDNKSAVADMDNMQKNIQEVRGNLKNVIFMRNGKFQKSDKSFAGFEKYPHMVLDSKKLICLEKSDDEIIPSNHESGQIDNLDELVESISSRKSGSSTIGSSSSSNSSGSGNPSATSATGTK